MTFKILQEQFNEAGNHFPIVRHVLMIWPETNKTPTPPAQCSKIENILMAWRDFPGQLQYRPGKSMMHWILRPKRKDSDTKSVSTRFKSLAKLAGEMLIDSGLGKKLKLSEYILSRKPVERWVLAVNQYADPEIKIFGDEAMVTHLSGNPVFTWLEVVDDMWLRSALLCGHLIEKQQTQSKRSNVERNKVSGDENETEAQNMFIREGQIWTIRFNHKPVFLDDSLLGLPLIEHLIRHTSENKKLSAFDLEKAVQKIPFDRMSESSEDIEDAGLNMTKTGTTVDNYALAMTDYDTLKDAIDHKKKERDKAKGEDIIKKFDEEIKILTTELKKRTDIHGKPRAGAGDGNDYDKARRRVIKNTMVIRNKLKNKHIELYNHFKTHLKVGTYCYYISDPKVIWKIF